MTETPRYVGYIAMSLDGFIAKPDGGVGWLDSFNEALADSDSKNNYETFIADIDAVLMGRATYKQVMGWGWPYGPRAGYVLTHRSDFSGDHVTAAGPIDLLQPVIGANGHKRVWILGGGQTQRTALDAGMFDALSVFLMPILLGAGLPCFAPGAQRDLTLTQTTKLPSGILKIDYTFKE